MLPFVNPQTFLRKQVLSTKPFTLSALHSISSSSEVRRIFLITVPRFRVTEVPFTFRSLMICDWGLRSFIYMLVLYSSKGQQRQTNRRDRMFTATQIITATNEYSAVARAHFPSFTAEVSEAKKTTNAPAMIEWVFDNCECDAATRTFRLPTGEKIRHMTDDLGGEWFELSN